MTQATNITLMAFDILPMSGDDADNKIQVAASLKTTDGNYREWGKVNRRKLLRLIQKHKPRFVGTDNPQELLFPGESLDRFYHQLPPMCNLVHVNANRRGITTKLPKLIRKHRIDGWDKRSPQKTARALIQLMEFGEGVILEPFEDETIIRVGQPKRHKKGGWSQDRFARQNEEVVLHASEKIKEVLDQKDVVYDLVERKTKYGAKFARFHTFLPRSQIGEYFAQVNLKPARIKFESPLKANVSRKNLDRIVNAKDLTLSRYEPRIIVGIDPGTTVGIAILNLRGQIMDVFSVREASKGEVVRILTDFGIPVAFCSDVHPTPYFVRKLAATFDAELISPNLQLSKTDKRSLTKDSEIKLRNNHEIDSLAAAVKGFRQLSSRFEKIDKKDLTTREKDLAKALLIRGLSATDATQAVKNLRRTPQHESKIIEQENSPDQELINRVNNVLSILASAEETIAYLRGKVARLETDVEQERRQKERWHRAMTRLRDENTLSSLKDDMVEQKSQELNAVRFDLKRARALENSLRDQIAALRETLWIGLQEGAYPIKVMKVFSHKGIEKLYEEQLSEGDMILIQDASGGGPQTARALADRKPRIIFLENTQFSPEAEEIFLSRNIPVTEAEGYNIRVLDNVAIINPIDFEQAIHDYEIYMRKRTKIKNVDAFLTGIQNYRYERLRQIEKAEGKYDDYEFDADEING